MRGRALRRLAREPLVQFLVLGVVVFGIEKLAAPRPRGVIDVSDETLAALRLQQEKRLGAPPTPAEERALVDRYVEGELLYREALALGLDRGDVIVRRRLIQKMQLLLEGDPGQPPGDAETRAFFAAHRDRYQLPATVSFEQVFIRTGPDAASRARAAAAALAAGADPRALGDPFVRGRSVQHVSADEVAAAFGPQLAAALPALAAGAWSAPLRSSYGLHLVRVTERTPARLMTFDEVATRVRQDCARERRAARLRRALTKLRERYQVHVDPIGSGS